MESIKQRITDTLEKNYMPYAMSVIVSRAIPEIDGFKPSHRKLLYTMYKMRLLSGQRTKSANVVGQTMKLNPHGDQAIYATLVRLTKGYDALLYPYIDSKGNFGKVTSRDMKFAAARYTEVKLDTLCDELFKDIEKDMVDFVDNYDGRMKEPVLLPTTFPNILVNANKGIAVGMASNMCSFNMTEIISATRAYLKNTEVDLMEHIKGPDFSTGGILIYHEKEMREIYNTGLGSFKIRAKYRYDKVNQLIEIYEIPYTTTIEAIIEKVVELIKNGRVKEISDIRDETDLNGLKITIDIKKGTDPDMLMTKLFKYTTLEDSFSCNFNLLVNGRPVVLGIKGILDAWIDFRMDGIRRKLRFDLKAISERLHLLYGLKEVLLDIDEAIRIIRDTPKDNEVIPNLVKAFSIDEVQADFIAEIKLRQINKEFILKRVAETQNLEQEMARIEEILKDDNLVKKVIADDLKRIEKTYQQPRKTEIAYADTIMTHKEEHDIEDFNLKVFVTAHGYLKKISLVSLRSGNQHKLKDDDAIIQELEGSNKDDLLVLTNKGNCYKLRLYEVEDHKASTLGTYLPNLLEFEPGEEPIHMAITGDYKGWLLFTFENGKVAKVPIKSYETKTNRKKLVKAYSQESPLIKVHQIMEETHLLCVRFAGSNDYTVLVAPTASIPEKVTKNTSGVQVIRLKKGSKLINTEIVDLTMPEESTEPHELARYVVDHIPGAGEKPDPIAVISGAWNERLCIK